MISLDPISLAFSIALSSYIELKKDETANHGLYPFTRVTYGNFFITPGVKVQDIRDRVRMGIVIGYEVKF